MTTYAMNTTQYDRFVGKLEALNRKAEKLGIAPTEMINVKRYNVTNESEVIPMVSFELVAHPVRLNGWQLVAVLDLSLGSALLRKLPSAYGIDIPDIFLDMDAHYCEHCHTKRQRKFSFIVLHEESNEFRQIGSSCLIDYVGHVNAEKIAQHCAMYDIEAQARAKDNTMHGPRLFDLATVVALGLEDDRGYISNKQAKADRDNGLVAYSTASHVMNCLADRLLPSNASVAHAEEIIRWAFERFSSPSNDYEYAIKVILDAGTVTDRFIGYAVSIIGAYKASQVKAVQPESRHIGEIGKPIVGVLTVTYVKEIDSQYGPSLLVVGKIGNDSVKFFSKDFSIEKGDRYNLKGKVKAHEFYKEEQTVLNYVKLEYIAE